MGHSHSTKMSSWATTTPMVRKPHAVSCTRSISRNSGNPLSAIAPPGSSANSKLMAARTAIAVQQTHYSFPSFPRRTVLLDSAGQPSLI